MWQGSSAFPYPSAQCGPVHWSRVFFSLFYFFASAKSRFFAQRLFFGHWQVSQWIRVCFPDNFLEISGNFWKFLGQILRLLQQWHWQRQRQRQWQQFTDNDRHNDIRSSIISFISFRNSHSPFPFVCIFNHLTILTLLHNYNNEHTRFLFGDANGVTSTVCPCISQVRVSLSVILCLCSWISCIINLARIFSIAVSHTIVSSYHHILYSLYIELSFTNAPSPPPTKLPPLPGQYCIEEDWNQLILDIFQSILIQLSVLL